MESTGRNPYVLRQARDTVTSSVLLLTAFSSAFFPRIIEAIGAPAPINFIHFGVVPIACLIVFRTSRVGSRNQLALSKLILAALYIYFSISVVSAFLNNAGLINVFLNFMIQSEPFIVLAAILYVPFTLANLNKFKSWVLGFGLIHVALALGQKFALDLGILAHTRLTIQDNVQGVFYLSSGGHVVGSTVSLIFGLYYYVSAKRALPQTKLLIIGAIVAQILFADAKQVMLVAIIAWLLLILSRTTDIKATLKYTILAILVIYTFYWCIYNIDVDFIRSYRTWIRPEIYGPNGDATVQKLFPLRTIPEYYTSTLNWFLGLGPGQTIGRIGGWMVRDYTSLLRPLGATQHPVTSEIWDYWNRSYLDSSFFSPFWGWAGIWGDVGFLGLASYLLLWWIVWSRVCKDDLSRFLVLNVIVNGFIFTLMEEPGFMLTTAMLLGLRWHELNSFTPASASPIAPLN